MTEPTLKLPPQPAAKGPEPAPPDPLASLRPLEGTGLSRVDPYLLWALVTHFRGFGGGDLGTLRVPFLVELANRGLVHELVAAGFSVPPSYTTLADTRFCTVRVAVAELASFLAHPVVLRADMGIPGAEVQGHPAPEVLLLPDARIGHLDWGADVPLIGIIDHGVAFLHRQFLHEEPLVGGGLRRTRRIVRLWDQWRGAASVGQVPSPPWKDAPGFDYGRMLAVQFDPAPGGHDEYPRIVPGEPEFEVYGRFGYRPVLGRAAHGTHVLSMAAGRPNPMARTAAGATADDAAGLLPIVAVQLPWLPAKDTSGASLCVHVLDALRFIRESAGDDRAVVVNISDGAMAGSHNAGSALEAALDEYLQDHPKLSVVVAAGNAFEERAHASGTVRSGEDLALDWQVLPDDSTESFLEIWLDEPANLTVELFAPGEAKPSLLLKRTRQVDVWTRPDPQGQPEVLAAGFQFEQVASGRGQLTLLALRPSREGRGMAVPHGRWVVRLTNLEPRVVAFNAWVERDDPPFGDPGPRRQSTLHHVNPARPDPDLQIDGLNTLNSIASGVRPVVVGGYRLSDDALARYTAAGSLDDLSKRPTVVAPCEESPSLPGLRGAGNASGSSLRMNGTSVAAPIVTRLIANTLADPAQAASATGARLKTALRNAAQARRPRPLPGRPNPSTSETEARTGSGWVAPGTPLELP